MHHVQSIYLAGSHGTHTGQAEQSIGFPVIHDGVQRSLRLVIRYHTFELYQSTCHEIAGSGRIVLFSALLEMDGVPEG